MYSHLLLLASRDANCSCCRYRDAECSCSGSGCTCSHSGVPAAAQDAPVEIGQPIDLEAIISTLSMVAFFGDNGEFIICQKIMLREILFAFLLVSMCITMTASVDGGPFVIQCPICRRDYYSLGL